MFSIIWGLIKAYYGNEPWSFQCFLMIAPALSYSIYATYMYMLGVINGNKVKILVVAEGNGDIFSFVKSIFTEAVAGTFVTLLICSIVLMCVFPFLLLVAIIPIGVTLIILLVNLIKKQTKDIKND